MGVFSDEINTDLTAFLIMFSIENLKRKNNLSIFFLINLLGSEQLQIENVYLRKSSLTLSIDICKICAIISSENPSFFIWEAITFRSDSL